MSDRAMDESEGPVRPPVAWLTPDSLRAIAECVIDGKSPPHIAEYMCSRLHWTSAPFSRALPPEIVCIRCAVADREKAAP